MINKKEEQKKAFNSLFDSTNYNNIQAETIEKVEQDIRSEEKKTLLKKKNYNIPIDILEDMEKIVYMDRDIKDNTDLLIRALRDYLSTKYCKDLINEYNILKEEKL